MLLYEFITESKSLFHVSRQSNRQSISKGGLQPRTQEFLNIARAPGVYLLGTLEQAKDWGFWFALDIQESVDIWQVNLTDFSNLINDPDPEMDIFNSYINKTAIAPNNIKLLTTIAKPTTSDNAPPFAQKI